MLKGWVTNSCLGFTDKFSSSVWGLKTWSPKNTEKKSVLGTGLFCCAQRILNGVQEMGVRTEWEI